MRAFPTKEMSVMTIKIAARAAMDANRMRRPRSPRELVPLAPSAARSCSKTWLKTWLRKTRWMERWDSTPAPMEVPVDQEDLAEASCALSRLVAAGVKPPGAVRKIGRAPG